MSEIPSPAAGGPTVLRMMLGARLRRLREANRITRKAAGYAIRASESKISRLELGRVGFKERDISDLLTLYGMTDGDERETCLLLARQANTPGWWSQYADVVPPWFEVYVGLEQAASRIRTYEVQFVPGLLQTEDYARAVTLLGHPDASPQEIERRVAVRMIRRRILEASDPPHLWAVIDEAALRRPLGDRRVMRGQLKHLIELAATPGVAIQVMPLRYGGHAAAGGPFSILRFNEPELPDVVYLEQLNSAVYLEKLEEVERYLAVMDMLVVAAEDGGTTVGTLTRALEET
ncbi:helix-turn-helix domain-containing protein [Actinomadura sp. HBU206391]|uniref:helix-turn-helix domain-containing protein n=1 Tax=Actinomadura sp. HBU206391 TaxID=2731692 RepID=UPI00164F22F7|nr:helix-turn-helix transcriptional regulator [Actinomadura sp. HBU206391]MBC6459053.1 helix-turn-helix domain-containing protein [Actinomadura sp. HBU206391]